MLIRSKFDKQMALLNEKLIEMGRAVEQSISMATEALITKNSELAQETIEAEAEVNEQEKDIENLCMKLLLLQNPMAGDLRMISAALKMITDMERIGDQATDIAEICLFLLEEDYIMQLSAIKEMAEAAVYMVHRSIDAFVRSDRATADAVIRYDDKIDELFAETKDKLYELMIANAENARQALDLLMIAKYYERIGDHAANIAEWVIFSITGEQKKELHKRIRREQKERKAAQMNGTC